AVMLRHRPRFPFLSVLLTSAALLAISVTTASAQPAAPSGVASTPQPSGTDELERGGLTVGESRVGYVDSAIPTNQFRLRFDAGYDFHRPNRAEFFYAKNAPIGGPGLPLVERSIDYQDFSAYIETKATDRLKSWFELPVRLINP